ncbi:hypothetical protein EROM_091500 [Encephalitozoon romaleae SJ-2008]|uniref:Uncharacterized protein n=1 Tax=Encephalitozoon romaleae (strain SJ-2008) TaxID=1178016 RepID=I6ZVK1_ENCRO|nr:hypothetical protein EROM_091500 [Encephalitozoon romaleae SJ-2008]AFN83766.1 hypothetical protein EROM_091500 [Encephalitozoon romaleae SJ-2008]
MEGEEKISASRRKVNESGWDEYSILNDSGYEKRSVDKENSLEWKSFENEGDGISTRSQGNIDCGLSGEISSIKRHRCDVEANKEKNVSQALRVKESVTRAPEPNEIGREHSIAKEASRRNVSEYQEVVPNISRQRYEEHMRKADCVSKEYKPGDEVSGGGGERTQEIQIQKEENMRKAIKIQEEDIQAKNQEILLLKEKISRLESKLEIEGKEYVRGCVLRGEEAIRIVEEELKKERGDFLKKIGEEAEKTRMLLRRIDGLKKIINELVRKIREMKQKTEGSRREDKL